MCSESYVFGLNSLKVIVKGKLQAVVYDILPSATAIAIDYAIALGKLSANGHLFVCFYLFVMTRVFTCLLFFLFLFITDHVAYASTNKTKIV